MADKVNVLAVLNRAAGDATGNPIEAGQAYAAIEAFKNLLEMARAVADACPEGKDWRMASGRGYTISSDHISDLRESIAGAAQ